MVSFPPGSPPVFDGPINTCVFAPGTPVPLSGGWTIYAPASHVADIEFGFTAVIGATDIVFRSRPSALAPSEVWRWRPGDAGFVAEGIVPFVPKRESGWTALLQGTIVHPFDFLDFGDTLAVAEALVGDARGTVFETLSGAGTGQSYGAKFVGAACYPRDCLQGRAFIYADGSTERLFLAWRIGRGVVTEAPPVNNWPGDALRALKLWRESP